ncbi:MAG: hypothetical protein JTJ26_05255, partial [Prevotella sp.]|nr:hypothetical protein [Prevotella sp.]
NSPFSIHNLYRLITVAKVRQHYYIAIAIRLKDFDEAATKLLLWQISSIFSEKSIGSYLFRIFLQ